MTHAYSFVRRGPLVPPGTPPTRRTAGGLAGRLLVLLLVLLVTVSSQAQTAATKLYWVQSSGTATLDQLSSANTDGSSQTTLASGASNFDNPNSLWFNTSSNTFYVGDGFNTAATGIRTFSLTGGLIATIVPGVANISINALQVVGNKLYWVQSSGTAANDQLVSANLDGTGRTTLASGASNFDNPNSLWVDAVNGIIYVGDGANSATTGIRTFSLTGTLLGTLVPGVSGIGTNGLQVAGNKLYWVQSSGTAANDALMSINLDGTGQTTLASGNSATTFYNPQSLRVDVPNSVIYVGDGAITNSTGIMRFPLTGGTGTNLVAGSNTISFNGLTSNETPAAPTVTTAAAGSITTTSAVLGGNVTADGGATVTERGVVYVAGTGTPTTSNTKALVATSGIAIGTAFSGTVTGLTPGAQYTVRAYAINSAGTSYGSPVSFTTASPPVLANIETTTLTYTAGDPRPQITNSLTVSDADSPNLTGGTVRIATGLVSAQDQLFYVNQNGITGSYNTVNGILTLTGTATLALYQTALRSIQYQNNAGVNATVGARLVSFVVSDANNTSNTQSRTINVVAQPVTAAPVVTAPANGSLLGTTTPTYTGTAVANSTVTVYVDGTSIGTTTATGGGTFSLTQPSALAQGSHTVRARAQSASSAQSLDSNTNTFTVDTVPPTVAITSTTAANGATSSAATFAYTATFSESVTGFVQGDLTVGNGTVSGFAGSGTTYTFNVTPSGNGAVTVNVPANVAVDAVGNNNTAATQYSITYAAPNATVVSVTRLTPSPTATTQVRYQVVFSSSVSGVTVSNFNITSTGTVSGTNVSSVVGSGTTYTVTVNTGTGDGSLRLNVNNSTGITPSITNVPYVLGETYFITKSFAAAPQLTIVGTGGTGSDVTAFVDAVQVLSGGTAVANALQNGSFEQHDPLSNGDFGYQPTSASWTFNTRAGIAESGSAFTPTTPIPNGIAVAFIQSNGAGANGQIQQNLALPTGSYQVNFQASQRVCCTTLDQSLNVFINGVFVGTIQPGDNNYQAFTSATFNVTAPALTATVSTTSASPTSTAPIPFSVSFSQSVGTSFTASDVTVTGGTLNTASFAGNGAGPYTFTVAPSGTGTVTVSLTANVANDANNTGNAASNSVSVQYNQPVTAAPMVIVPSNGSLVSTTTPTYAGTAPAGSLIRVYVDGVVLANTVTTNGAGNWAISQPTVLTQGSHTVYATAQTSGSTVSVNSNTNTFTVDSVRPTVAISSTAGASGSTTSTTPLPFTVTFSEAVTGFVAGDVSVTNGTLSGFSGSGTTYTFNVTPTTAGTATTVNVAANVAQDQAGNGNTAAVSAYSITFQAPTIVVAPATLPNGTVASAYSQTLTVSGGTAPYSFAITAGALPAGLSLTSAGVLSGTPSASGSFTFTVTATDASSGTGPYTGSRTYPLTIGSQPVTTAPVITSPANGSVTNQGVTISGTAPANSTVTLYLTLNGGAPSPATVTATAAGTFSVGLLPFPDATYTVYATAQSPGAAVSANSATITFTVDQTAPTVAISSTAGASGGTTTTTPIPFTVTFSEAVTGFVAGDVTVTNGTIGTVSGSGTTYTFTVTPTTAGTATTVTVPANVAVDAAGNGNTAGTPSPYSITYSAPVTATVWTGATNIDWFAASNWTAGVPTTSLDATIPTSPSGGRFPAIVAGTASARNLTLSSGASLTQFGGTLQLAANLTNNGTFQPTGGTVSLGGTTLSSILGSGNTRFWNLTIGASGAQSGTSASTSVLGLLTLNGPFTTNGNAFTLESNANATALVVNNSGTVVGTTSVQRYLDPSLNAGLGYRHYSSPVQSTTVADLATSTFAPVVNPAYNTTGTTVRPFPTVFGYDETRVTGTNATTQSFDQGYFSPASLSDALTVGRGYTVNLDAANKVDLMGTLNNGPVSVGALSRGSEANAGWHLLGNPYPAPLDWSVARTGLPTGVIDAVYVFKSSSQYAGTYQFFQNGFGTLPGGLISSMQGFFVRVSQPVAAFNFSNAWRATTYQNPTFNRGTADVRPSVQLELVSAQGARDAAFVYFEQGATAGMDDHYDAAKLPNTTGLNLASLVGSQQAAVNGLPLLGSTSVTVPLALGLPATGTYSLHAAQLLNFAAGAQPFLRDLQLNTLTDLSQTPDYTFTMNAANTTPRFELVFGPAQVLGTASAALAAQVAVFPNPAHAAVSVELPASLNRKAVTAALVDALGRVVLTKVLPVGLATHALPLTGIATGVYSLRLQTEAGMVVKKLVVE